MGQPEMRRDNEIEKFLYFIGLMRRTGTWRNKDLEDSPSARNTKKPGTLAGLFCAQ
jgi:hypothetical protein